MSIRVLTRDFYERDTVKVAKELLGKLLVRKKRNTEMMGKIVEVEAYRGTDDPASHAFRGRTDRNKVMFGPGGYAYVYFIYGNHYCFNVTAETKNVPGAVLIRAVEPVKGVELMQANRGARDLKELTNGPGKLTKAMEIVIKHNGIDLATNKELFICEPHSKDTFGIVATERIGIRVGRDKPWRFHIRNNEFVSRVTP